jgi:DNA adenine methylase
MSTTLTPPLKWHGGKHYLARRIVALMPSHLHYVEPFRKHDGPGTLFYCAPPYLPETRTARGAYAFEMSAADHRELLGVLRQCRGKVMLSGYPSALYDATLACWTRHTFDLPNNAAGREAKGRETEVVWCNW